MTGRTLAVADSAAGLTAVLEWGERDGVPCEVAVVLPRQVRSREQLRRLALLAREAGARIHLCGGPLALLSRPGGAARVVVGAGCSRTVRLALAAGGARGVTEARATGHGWARRRFGSPAVRPGTDLIGAPDVAVDDIATLAHRWNAERYLADPREGDRRLRDLAARSGLDVVRPELPLEIELLRGPVAAEIVTLRPAPALALLLAGTGVRVRDAAGSSVLRSGLLPG